MLKFPNEKPREKGGPEIWSEGKQFAPLNLRALASVSTILARRMAAKAWNSASSLTAGLAIALEDGFASKAVANLGPATSYMPSRATLCRNIARFSRLQSHSAVLIDHLAEEIVPLEQGDLTSFMLKKREEAYLVAQERNRKVEAARLARERTAKLFMKAATRKFTRSREAELAPEDADDLRAIRAALDAYREPAAENASSSWFYRRGGSETKKVKPIKKPNLFEHSTPPSQGQQSDFASASLTRRNRFFGAILLAFKSIGWLCAGLWALVSPGVARATMWIFGWGMVGILLPLGVYKALKSHFGGQDLREFD